MFLDHLTAVLPTCHFREMISFYGEVLRLKRLPSPERSAIFSACDTGFVRLNDERPLAGYMPTALWMEASYVDDLYELIRQNDRARFLILLQNMYYGSREFQTLDPDGNISCIINYEKDLHNRRPRGLSEGLYGSEFRAVFYIKNLAACYHFYAKILGLTCVYEWKEHEGDRGFKFELCPASHSYIEILFREPKSPLRQGIVELRTQDIRGCFGKLAQRDDCYVERPLVPGGPNLFELVDPDGNRVRITE